MIGIKFPRCGAHCPHAKAVPGARVAFANEREIQHATDAGALVVVVPTVRSEEEAIEARDWTFFPPLGKRSLGGGTGFRPEMWGNVPGGYRQTANDNIVLILMIETVDGVKDAYKIAKVPGVTAVFAASGDLGNFSGYKQGTPDYERLINTVHDAAIRPASGCADRTHGGIVRTSLASRPAAKWLRSRKASPMNWDR